MPTCRRILPPSLQFDGDINAVVSSYADDDVGTKPAAAPVAAAEPAPAVAANGHGAEADTTITADYNDDYDGTAARIEEDEDDDEVDFNLGANAGTNNAPAQEVSAPASTFARGPSSKEDG